MNIRCRNLVKWYRASAGGPLCVLDGTSFEVHDGEFVTLLGPSGCGKTTVLKIIAGLERVDEGEVQLSAAASARTPIVWQEHRLFPWRTVLRNVSFPLEVDGHVQEKADEMAMEHLDAVDLAEFASYYPWQISGGMAGRVAIARALASESRCLLMDEPFSSVDYQTKQILLERLESLKKKKQLTIVYVTHDLRDAIAHSDRIVVFSGRPARVREVVEPTSDDLPRSDLEQHLWALLR